MNYPTIHSGTNRSMSVHIGRNWDNESTHYLWNDLLFESLEGEESISNLPAFTIQVLHPSSRLNLSELLGQNLSVQLQTLAEPRYLGGLITHARFMGPADPNHRYYRYEFLVSPSFWLTTLNQEYRIFQNKTVLEIIDEVLTTYDFEIDIRAFDRYSEREYCVQYDESDFNFVTRLLEEEGIHYYIQYHADKQTLVISDTLSTHKKQNGYETVAFYEGDKVSRFHKKYLSDYQPNESLGPSTYSTDDYNFLKPTACYYGQGNKYLHAAHHPKADIFEWPGGYTSYNVGELYIRKRAEELQYQRNYLQFSGTIRGLALGSVFSILYDPNKSRTEDHRKSRSTIEYTVLASRYDLKEAPYHSLGSTPTQSPHGTSENHNSHIEASDHQQRCLIHLTVQDSDLPFRPTRKTPKPRTLGPQTAVVVGPENHEIWTNEHGQVKVQFRWDRYGKHDENSSCWIRVSNAWAGTRFGAIQIPRIGEEVIVDFLNGDPDRPIITGRVYNIYNTPPWELPLNATQAGFYSRSSPDGNHSMGNALRFEDKTGHEEVYIHAQKDLNEKIGNHHSLRVDMNQVQSVGHNKSTEVSNNLHEVIGGDMTLSIGPSQKGRFTPSNASQMREGIGHVAYELGAPESESETGGNLLINVEHNKLESIGSDLSQVVDNNKKVTVMSNYFLEVGEELLINADKRIVLKCGESMIVLNPDGSMQLNGNTLKVRFTDVIQLLSDIIRAN